MDADEINFLLQSWGFPELAESFLGRPLAHGVNNIWPITPRNRNLTSNGVDLSILKISQFEDIAPLLSGLNLGQRIKFKRNFEAWERNISIEIIPEVPSEVFIDSYIQETEQILSANDGPTTPQKSPGKQKSITPPRCSAPSNVSPEHLRSSMLRRSPDRTAVPVKSTTCKFVSKNLFSRPADSINCSESLGQLIQSSHLIGQSVIHCYNSKGYLDKSSRNKLAKLIISAELSESVDKKIDTPRFLKLAEWIVEVFPSELKEIWFTPFKTLHGKRRVPARGKLVDLYHNIRRNLIKSQIISSKRSSSQVKRADTSIEGGIDEEVQLKLDWLKKTGKPFETAIHYWQETFSVRRCHFMDHCKSIHEYFEDFGFLKNNSGSKLLSLDFDILHQNHGQNLFSMWPIFKEKLLTFFKRKLQSNKGLEGVSEVLGINVTAECDDLSTVNALRALALLLALCKPIKGSKLTWKPTKRDAVDGVMTVVQSSADLRNAVERKKALYEKYGLSFQPLPFIVVDKSLKSCSSYVVINNCYYNFDSPIVALDFCFKSFHVLYAKYPAESKVAWNFIQTQLYKLKTDGDENFLVMQQFVQDLQML